MNALNPTHLHVNTARYEAAHSRKKIVALDEIDSTTDTHRRNQSNNRQRDSRPQLIQDNLAFYSQRPVPSNKHYQAQLLNEMINKMSGVEPRFHPGHFVEYFA